MATVRLGPGGDFDLLEGGDWFSHYSEMSVAERTDSTITYLDLDGDRIVLSGDTLASSVVTEVLIEDKEGRMIIHFTGLSLALSPLEHAIANHDADNMALVFDFLPQLLQGNDKILGTDSPEELVVASDRGDDIIRGFGGDDFFRAMSGSNNLNGGAGHDTLAYHTDWMLPAPTRGLNLNAEKGVAINPWGGRDTFKNFESYRGSQRADVLKGNDTDETFTLLGGGDKLNGRGGFDTVRYSLDVDYGGSQGVLINLSKGTAVDGFGATDTLKGIEAVIGTDADDVFVGSKKSDVFYAREGVDVLTGRGGADRFVFSAGIQDHTITDFITKGRSHDTIELNDFEGIEGFADLQERMTQVGDDVVIDLGVDATLTLTDVALSSLADDHFQF